MSAFVTPTPVSLTSTYRLSSTCPASGSLRSAALAARSARSTRAFPVTSLSMEMDMEQGPVDEAPAPEENKLFVGNLSWGTTDASLGEAFAEFGTVVDAHVVTDRFTGKSRGFGFIEFEAASAAEDALVGMNGVDLDGRNVRVDRATRRQPRQRRSNNYDNNNNYY